MNPENISTMPSTGTNAPAGLLPLASGSIPTLLYSLGIGVLLGAPTGALASGGIAFFFTRVATFGGDPLGMIGVGAFLGALFGLGLGVVTGAILFFLAGQARFFDQLASIGAGLCGLAGGVLGVVAALLVTMVILSEPFRPDWVVASMMIGAGIAGGGGWLLGAGIQWLLGGKNPESP